MQVCSFRRSGTHLLLATLYRAFEWPDDVAGRCRVTGRRWYANGSEVARVPWHDIFGSHEVAAHVLPQCGVGHVLYVWRDPADVLVSLYRFLGRPGEFSGWARRWYPDWREHVTGYLDAGCAAVTYAELVADPHAVVARVAARWRMLVPRPEPDLPVRERVGWQEPADLPTTKDDDRAELLPVARAVIASMGGGEHTGRAG